MKNNLLVDCNEPFLGVEENEVQDNNQSINSEGNLIEHFYTSETLNNYNMESIPVHKTGPLLNKWNE